MTTPTLHPTLTIARPDRKRFWLLLVSVIGTDLITKSLAVLILDDPVDLGPLTLRVSHNSGVAFSVGNQFPTGIVLGLTGLLTIAVIFVSLRGQIGTGMGPAVVAGGAAANVIDRIHNASVVDFIDFGWWPAFNLADTAIVVGGTLIVIQQLRIEHRQHRERVPDTLE